MILTYSPTKKQRQVTLDKARKDIDTRLGNIVLNSVKELRTNKNLYFSVINQKSEIEIIDPVDSIDEYNSSGPEFDLTTLAELYADPPDFDKAISLLDAEHRKGNILATYEIGKINERNLADSDPV